VVTRKCYTSAARPGQREAAERFRQRWVTLSRYGQFHGPGFSMLLSGTYVLPAARGIDSAKLRGISPGAGLRPFVLKQRSQGHCLGCIARNGKESLNLISVDSRLLSFANLEERWESKPQHKVWEGL
jgi:hypothetical protein